MHAETSEQLHGIMPQPAESCPIIDSVLERVGLAQKQVEGWQRMNEQELSRAADYVEWHLSSVPEFLETLRARCAEIREWGDQWKKLAKTQSAMLTPNTQENAPQRHFRANAGLS